MSTLAEIEKALPKLTNEELLRVEAMLRATQQERAGGLPEHSRVRVKRALPAEGVAAGAVGTVVHVYAGGAGYEVEFVAGRPSPAVVTLSADDLEPAQ